MFLEKIELHGFKSFAKKTTIQFAATGGLSHNLTVIVGPNGSGKSNVADAVRWVLGEQSSKTLRGKKSEDVIFTGSARKGKMGMAEVSLFLNNEDKKASIDYTQLVITRRLYRDGVSEYLINGSKVRLADITILLARARFGQRAYSVVGQGMVDSFLNTTPTERKSFFDEATGVKVFQIKKHDAELKFRATEQNLEQVETLLAEVEPRLRSLTRQVKKLQQRDALTAELRDLQKKYYAYHWHTLRDDLTAVNTKVVALEKEQRTIHETMVARDNELANKEKAQYQTTKRNELQATLRELQGTRNTLGQKLAEVRAQKGVVLDKLGKAEISWLSRKADELRTAVDANTRALKEEERAASSAVRALSAVQREQQEIDGKIRAARRAVMEVHTQKSDTTKDLLDAINSMSAELFRLNDEVHALLENNDIDGAKQAFQKLHQAITTLKQSAHQKETRAEGEVGDLQQQLIQHEEEKQECTERYIAAQNECNRTQAALEQRQGRISDLEGELHGIEKKLSQNQEKPTTSEDDFAQQEEEVTRSMKDIDDRITEVENQLYEINEAEARVREEIIALQKESHAAQKEYNQKSQELNSVQVEKARLETRLEDLESEIRRETNALRDVVECVEYEVVEDEEIVLQHVQKLKRQLELIGGIDEETMQEYEETKERYEFLHEQAVDLRKAITSLKTVIAELEERIQITFNRAFKDIAKKFEEYFQVLFDGGSAKLEKIMEDEKTEEDEVTAEGMEELEEVKRKKNAKQVFTGIDVLASPPHKKIKHISMLSGGERALTSIALIAAIIAVNPSPFVMLDEVDAALDEANSRRLAKILDDLSKKTQFIAITHNRTIMYQADIIYGVTMGDDGISKLLSVKVEDVKAARQ